MTTYGRTNAVTAGGGTPTPTQTKEVQATAFPTVVTPDEGYALSQATVTAPANLSAENIKKDVTIAGVTGSFEGAPVGDLKAFIAGTMTDELTLSEMRSYAFYQYPQPISINIANGVTSIPEQFAYRAKINTCRIPGSVKTIGNYAFGGDRDVSKNGTFEIEEGVTSLGTAAFYGRRFTIPMKIPDSVVTIGYSAFEESARVYLTENNNVETIEGRAFPYGAVFKENQTAEVLHLPKIKVIKNQAFYSAHFPYTIVLGPNITTIEFEGLRGNNSPTTKLVIKATTPPTIQSNSFEFSSTYEIVVPVGCLAAYQSATNWSQYADHMREGTE